MNLAQVPVKFIGNHDAGRSDQLADFRPFGSVRANGGNVYGHGLQCFFAVAERLDVVGTQSFQVPDFTDGFFEFHQNVLALFEDSAVFNSVLHTRKQIIWFNKN